ncbi:hypothetical protein GCM10009734_27580 [Nonomuraea bangladeshensis]
MGAGKAVAVGAAFAAGSGSAWATADGPATSNAAVAVSAVASASRRGGRVRLADLPNWFTDTSIQEVVKGWWQHAAQRS